MGGDVVIRSDLRKFYRGWLPLAIARWLPLRIIEDTCHPELGPMLVRHFILRTRWIGIYLHHFLRSDNDRHFHDHPWSFLTVPLGRYLEHTPQGAFWRGRFRPLWRPAEWRHWVEVHEPVWTLVMRFPRRREWGFWTEKGWVDWRTYDREWCE